VSPPSSHRLETVKGYVAELEQAHNCRGTAAPRNWKRMTLSEDEVPTTWPREICPVESVNVEFSSRGYSTVHNM
jgi:hypothetical protein